MLHISAQNLIVVLLATMASTSAHHQTPGNNDRYTALIRKNLASFHKNLSAGNYASNGALITHDVHWNYDGSMIIGRGAAVAALGAVSNGPLKGIQVSDQYTIVDGNVGMTLYGLHGSLSGPLPGVPFKEGARFSALGVERFFFDDSALLYDLVTVDQFGRIAAQVSGDPGDVPSPNSGDAPPPNPQTSPAYRDIVRRNLAALHQAVNGGNAGANKALAVENVIVNDNGVVRDGAEAFVKLVSSQNAGLGAFPDKKFHDFYVVADGNQGGVEYVWQGEQRGPYNGIDVIEGAQVRVRGMLFFELNGEGLVTKVTGVHDEAHVGAQLSGQGRYLYP